MTHLARLSPMLFARANEAKMLMVGVGHQPILVAELGRR